MVPPVGSEAALGKELEARLEGRLAAVEATVRDLAVEVAGLAGRVAANEWLLAASIERLLWVQQRVMWRAINPGQRRLALGGVAREVLLYGGIHCCQPRR